MSLKVWIPGIDGMKNQGLGGDPNLGTSTSNTNGKIGTCQKITTNYDSNCIINPNTTDITMCGWFKFNQSEIQSTLNNSGYNSNRTTPTGNLLGQNNYGGLALCYSTNNQYSSSGAINYIYVFGAFRDSNSSSYCSTQNIPFDTWTHITLTWNHIDKQIILYINGVQKSSSTRAAITSIESWKFQINLNGVHSGNGPGCKIPFYFNDIRCYDNLLTALEVKEISKGLVAHYTLGSACAEAPALRSRLSSATWNQLINPTRLINASGSGVTCTVDANKGSITCTGTSSGYACPNIGLSSNTLTNGHKYLMLSNPNKPWNGDPSSTGGSFDFRLNNQETYYSDRGSGCVFTATSNNHNFYLRFGKNYVTDGLVFYPMLFDLTAIYGSGNEPTAANFKKAFPMTYYQYDSGTTKDLRLPIPDSSGYSRNLTITGNVSPADSPRYKKGLQGNGTLTTSNITINTPFTISMWVQFPITSSTGSGNEVTIGPFNLYKDHDGVDKHTFSVTKSDTTNTYLTLLSPAENRWYHVAITSDGTNVKIYKDGNVGTYSIATRNGLTTFKLMQNNNIKMSDVRIYATALSTDDVKDLYNLGASIS